MEAKIHGIEPEEVGYSLANLTDVLLPCLDAAGARSVAEIGAFTGSFTSVLLRWAAAREARITAIDPNAEGRLVELAAEHPELDLVYERSREALADIAMPDAVIFDGDHNYYAVTEDLRLLAGRVDGGPLPLLLFHDVGWPHGRRDVYFEPDKVPSEHRQPMVYGATIAPSEPGLADGGLEYAWIAEREGGRATACSRRSRTSPRPAGACASQSSPRSSGSASRSISPRPGRAASRRCSRAWAARP